MCEVECAVKETILSWLMFSKRRVNLKRNQEEPFRFISQKVHVCDVTKNQLALFISPPTTKT